VLEQEAGEEHKLGHKIAMEEDWLRYGVTARRTRNQRRLAELHALRRKRKEQRAAQGSVRLEAAQAELSGRLIAVAQGISKSYGGRSVVRDFSARIMRGDRVGIVGPNGAGKTTLLNLLTGALMPDTGEVRLGTNLAQVILDQRRETLDPEQSLTEALTGGSGDTVRKLASDVGTPTVISGMRPASQVRNRLPRWTEGASNSPSVPPATVSSGVGPLITPACGEIGGVKFGRCWINEIGATVSVTHL
jgi:ATPase subunit of ABC transporter with duplicated ATPase domains